MRLVLLVVLVGCFNAPPPPSARPTFVVTPPDAAPADGTDEATADAIPDATADGSNGSDTELVARRWKYAHYFNQLKHHVYAVWDPVSVYKQLPASVTKTLPPTVTIMLHVKLTPAGAVDSVIVKTSSSVAELDVEAVRAFRAAGPFTPVPDPPPKLDFDFALYFEIGSGTKRP